MQLLTFKECVENPKKIVGLRFDRMFKEVFGSLENKDLTVYLLSILLDKSEDEINSGLKMLPERVGLDSIKQKKQAWDLAVILVSDKTTQINIEVNIREYDQILQDRNMIYLSQFVSHSIDTGQSYSKIKNTVQYNLNTYYVKNDEGCKFTKIIKIVCWNIYKMMNIWYDGSIKDYPAEMQEKIRLGALIMLDDKEDFLKCLSELSSSSDIKNKIERIVIGMNENSGEVWTRYYDPEEEAERIRVTYESIGLEQGMEKGLEKGMEQGVKIAVCNMHKNNIEVEKIATIMNMKQQEVYKYLQM